MDLKETIIEMSVQRETCLIILDDDLNNSIENLLLNNGIIILENNYRDFVDAFNSRNLNKVENIPNMIVKINGEKHSIYLRRHFLEQLDYNLVGFSMLLDTFKNIDLEKFKSYSYINIVI